MTLILILIGVSFGLKAQTSEFSFTDKYGNEIKIENTKMIPELIDEEFLKNNLNGTHFTFKLKEDAELKFEYRIMEFVRISKMEYRIRILQKPKSDKAEDIIRYVGYSNYRMKLKKTKSGIELKKVEFMYAEI
ncbi:hypothetical protein [Thalassobellus sediminis]|uniref:hypothetical protein n=1 Tax=Thalassobellus sediminis TaxID=3367753 RepID=UPI0037977F6D